MSLSLILPCFNEEANIAATVESVCEWFERKKMEGEVIVVDDGSKDRSPQILEELKKKYPILHVVRHEKNQGYGLAVRSGCDSAKSDIVGFMDSDGQFHIDDIELLLAHIDQYQFVTGRRRKRADSFIRNMFGKILGVLIIISFQAWIRDVNCGMKIFRKSLWPTIRPTHGTEKLYNAEMFLRMKKAGIKWHTVNVPHYPRRAGNPTGGSARVIIRMFKELMDIKRGLR